MITHLIIHQITLPEEQDVEAFVEFMRNEYFPAVHKGPTRVGQVISLALLESVPSTHKGTNTFFMHAGWSGLAGDRVGVDDAEVRRKFESFGARVERLGAYREVAIWPEAAEA